MINAVSIKEVKTKLGELCKQKRQAYEMSQEDLAKALDLSRFTIQKFESGKNATLDTVLKIAHHFDWLESFYQALKNLESTNDIDSLY
ncbi:helix-turn-helix transcriptional regulator [Mesonia aquimarina]|uniref:helix-turn-helix transcriptional regulator n=1 Tax=Mesonia aquimarina TaxID=1504967 RepID=UPI000EF5B99A|nr:helix-turn-helix transcriptional regulator [Mesonia aquimarina]